jgi:hypothetical protein
VEIVNQTGRTIRIRRSNGEIAVWAPNPNVPVAKAVPRYLGGEVLNGVAFVLDTLHVTSVEGLMLYKSGRLLIVEDEVRRECLDRPDLISPMKSQVDERGQPTYSHGFITNRQIDLAPSSNVTRPARRR